MSDSRTSIRVPARGTRGSRMMDGIMGKVANRFGAGQIKKLQNAPSPEAMKFMGSPALVLTTIGAKSGIEHAAVLGGFPDGENAWLVVASKGGSATHPAWFFNVARNPDKVWFQVGNRKMRAHVESLQGKEREDAYARVVAVAKGYGGYLKKTDREIPVLRLTPAD
jgi:deazaflavin-dependent oxidoreductase (nitroreductase family)